MSSDALFGNEGSTTTGDDSASVDLARRLPGLRDAGCPDGSDASIVAMSRPDAHTACPNPYIDEWLAALPPRDDANRPDPGPFTEDATGSKTGLLYSAHSYPTKVPPEIIARQILHYTRPGDVILDGFAGSGMAGVAAQLCGRPDFPLRKGDTLRGLVAAEGPDAGDIRWGARRAILNDLAPNATFIAAGLNLPVDAEPSTGHPKRCWTASTASTAGCTRPRSTARPCQHRLHRVVRSVHLPPLRRRHRLLRRRLRPGDRSRRRQLRLHQLRRCRHQRPARPPLPTRPNPGRRRHRTYRVPPRPHSLDQVKWPQQATRLQAPRRFGPRRPVPDRRPVGLGLSHHFSPADNHGSRVQARAEGILGGPSSLPGPVVGRFGGPLVLDRRRAEPGHSSCTAVLGGAGVLGLVLDEPVQAQGPSRR